MNLKSVVIVCCLVIHIFFFFSSRRRHTIWPRDWSSDVCSSDLNAMTRRQRPEGVRWERETDLRKSGLITSRSEERRVGKEWRLWWMLSQSEENYSAAIINLKSVAIGCCLLMYIYTFSVLSVSTT